MDRGERNLRGMRAASGTWLAAITDALAAAPLVRESEINDDGTTGRDTLTAKEAGAVAQMSHGDTRQEAAAHIGISLDTLADRLTRAKRALRTRSTIETVAEAIRRNMIA